MPPRGLARRTALRPRRPPVGNDAPPGHARPQLATRAPRRIVLRPAAGGPPSRPCRRGRVRGRPAPRRDGARVGSRPGRRTRPAPARHVDRRGDRRRLRDVRGGARKGALGRQDADVHAAPAPARAAVPRGALRPPCARRPRRRGVLPADAGGDRDGVLGAPEVGRRLRLPMGHGDRGRARARPSCRTRALPRASVRTARRVAQGRARTDLLLRRPALGAFDARLRNGGGRQRAAAPAEPEATSDHRPPELAHRARPRRRRGVRGVGGRRPRRARLRARRPAARQALPARGRAPSCSRTARRHGHGERREAPSGARPSGPGGTRLSSSGCPAG